MHDIANTRLQQASIHSITLKSANGFKASFNIVQRRLEALAKQIGAKTGVALYRNYCVLQVKRQLQNSAV